MDNYWLFLALLAPAIYTVVNFIDKYVVEDKVDDYRGMPIYAAVVALVFGTSFWFAMGRPVLSFQDAALVVGSGMLTMYGFALYFRVISQNHTSLVIMLLQLTPVFSLVLSFLVLGEIITLRQFIGFLLVLASVMAVSVKRGAKVLELSSAFYQILVADIIFAITGVLIKFTINANSLAKIVSYESWGIFLGGLTLFLLFPTVRHAFLTSFKSVGKPVLVILFFNEVLFIISKALTFLALALGPVALVSVLGSTQVFYGILYGSLLTFLAPATFQEDITLGGLLKKTILAVILLGGIWLIY